MITRFSDDVAANHASADFIIRERKPFITTLILVFMVVFCIIYFTGLLAERLGSPMLFLLVLLMILGLLGGFMAYFLLHHRDMTLATEFQNLLFASAAQISTRFCLILREDGGIIYFDPGFQTLFPQFMRSGSRTLKEFLACFEASASALDRLQELLAQKRGGSVLVALYEPSGVLTRFIVALDMLPRPGGYYILRGREYIEKRTSPATHADKATSLLGNVVEVLPEGALLVDGEGIVLYANPALEALLGYDGGEIVASSLTLFHVLRGYGDTHAQHAVSLAGPEGQGFEGIALFVTKQQKTERLYLRQTLVHDGDQTLGATCIVSAASAEGGGVTPPLLSHFIATSPLAIVRLGNDGSVLEYNPALLALVRQPMPSAGWRFIDIVHPGDQAEVTARLQHLAEGQPPEAKPLEIALGAEGQVTASLYLSQMNAQTSEIFAQLIDTTEQKNLEQRFAHSQKMQAVGQLAGGVAHDFNNLLTAMIGFCDLLLMRHPAGDQSFADIMQVKQNANRAANLVRQLLAFSRRQTLQPKMLDITDVLAELSNLVRRLIGENIELKVVHGRDLGLVKADQGQLEQVFINLAVNARDAMLNGGQLTIRSSHVTIDARHPVGPELVPPLEDEAITQGDYVLVEVVDTGTGISRDLLQKIFEPFFSTKEVGSGTGLGLATVYGIIKQTGGYVYVTSQEGRGTTFSLFFKRYQLEAAPPAPEAEARVVSDDLTGKGTILLVEDETPVRTFAARALRNKGYTVLEADCGETAIEVMERQGHEVDVIITDVIMPGINGPAMIEEVAPKFPQVRVVFISGYAEDIFVKSYGSDREFNFLPKPFTLKQLASKVKEVLQDGGK